MMCWHQNPRKYTSVKIVIFILTINGLRKCTHISHTQTSTSRYYLASLTSQESDSSKYFCPTFLRYLTQTWITFVTSDVFPARPSRNSIILSTSITFDTLRMNVCDTARINSILNFFHIFIYPHFILIVITLCVIFVKNVRPNI